MKIIFALFRNRPLLVLLLVILIIFPFVYFFQVAYSKTLLSEAWFNYIVFTATGILFGAVVSGIRAFWMREPETRLSILKLFKLLVIFYALFLIIMTISRYNRYLSEAIDVFYYHSAVWQLSEFKLPMYDNGSAPVWADHFEPIIFFIVPFYWIIHNALFIFATQALVAISGALPLYLSAKKFLSSKALALSISCSYLLFGGMQFGYAYGFHPIVFLPAIFFWMYYFYILKKTKLYFLFVVLCLFVKEEVAFIVFFWGVYLFFVKKDKKIGAVTSALGAVWYVICFQLIFPFFNKGGGYRHFGQYAASFSASLVYGYVGYSPFFLENKSAIPDNNLSFLNDNLRNIPKNASITALYQIAPRLDTYYGNVRIFPQKKENSDYVVVDLLIPPVLLKTEVLNKGGGNKNNKNPKDPNV